MDGMQDKNIIGMLFITKTSLNGIENEKKG